MQIKAKEFNIDVRGEWKDADPMGESCVGHWHWEEAREKLLSQCNSFIYCTHYRIISVIFEKYSGIDIDSGASMSLLLTYECDY